MLIASTENTNYNDTDVVNGSEYCYYTTAVNDAGESIASNLVCATPESGTPTSDILIGVEDFNIDVGISGEFALTMDNEDGVAGFQFNLNSSTLQPKLSKSFAALETTSKTSGCTFANPKSLLKAIFRPLMFLSIDLVKFGGVSLKEK